ncbi:putative mitochondrial carnitine O-acetyltransferase [Glarea lozoyensis 74030]|uniref:Putative mitochondrial carnitine O-acetyltransferase n=1 Tax=Glarea lozoyensis (strain ATCC 74030 / MF5533) TaxID=1104152 RepID=H0EQ98_GLAL7|nr:putative mitochondrial carnitine O-acetyltransferase [Glarea lozoyensis 74030]
MAVLMRKSRNNQPNYKQGITFAAQDKLPKLPIPELEQSMTRYLAALKPLQSPREHAESTQAVEEFLKSEGPELQERLKKYATGKTSYIEQFSRVPTENGCHIGQDPEAKHIVVLCHGQFYWFDVLDDNSDLIMTEKDVSINLQTIVDDAQKTPIQDAAKGALGVLSTENRKICDLYTDTILRFARTINGQAPSLWASTSPDPSKRDPASFGDVNTTPHKLEWDMVPELGIALRFAETRLADLIQQNEFQTLDFNHYGKNFMTSMGFSPDAFVQMAFQAAYYGLYGRVECTYEPAMTKMFLHGRTEAIRSVTPASVDFVQTFWGEVPPQQKVDALKKACQEHTANTRECAKAQGCDRHMYALFSVWQRGVDDDGAEAASSNGLSSNGYSSPIEGSVVGSPPRSTDLTEALSTHSRNNSSSSPRRHRAPPHIFQDAGWDKLNNTILSTSNCGNPSLRHFGFGPTSGDGFGIGYIIKDEGISICASSKHRQTKRFVDALESYLLEIRRILRSTQRRGTSPKASRAREASARPKAGSRLKSRGRVIKATGMEKEIVQDSTSNTASDDEGLGGCVEGEGGGGGGGEGKGEGTEGGWETVEVE